jgi:hypothetical protein
LENGTSSHDAVVPVDEKALNAPPEEEIVVEVLESVPPSPAEASVENAAKGDESSADDKEPSKASRSPDQPTAAVGTEASFFDASTSLQSMFDTTSRGLFDASKTASMFSSWGYGGSASKEHLTFLWLSGSLSRRLCSVHGTRPQSPASWCHCKINNKCHSLPHY